MCSLRGSIPKDTSLLMRLMRTNTSKSRKKSLKSIEIERRKLFSSIPRWQNHALSSSGACWSPKTKTHLSLKTMKKCWITSLKIIWAASKKGRLKTNNAIYAQPNANLSAFPISSSTALAANPARLPVPCTLGSPPLDRSVPHQTKRTEADLPLTSIPYHII